MGRKEEEVLICISTAAVLWCCFLLLPRAAAATSTMASPSPVCAGSAARPVELREPLGFCGHAGLSCCDAVDDEVLRAELEAMNISDDTCAAVAKAFLCAKCIPSLSSVLFNTVDPTTTKLAIARLCASTSSLTSVQQHPVTAATGSSRQDQNTMCLERISSGSYIAMAAHPDGSGRVFLSTRDGKIFLAAMPRPGFGVAMRVDSGRTRPFLDLRDRVLGILGMAFHPDFAINGRFFVSYYCDSSRSTACGAGRCWGDAAAAPGNSSCSCRYRLVVAEFSAKGGPENYSKATRADPSEVRRIFAMGLPQPQKLYSYQRHHGQILLRPGGSDRYLYLISGHGDFSKNGRSFLGKILRFDVDRMLKAGGNGTQQMSEPEIFSMGVNNPSGCSFDSDRPSRLYCADVNEQRYERVNLITNNGGNHGISPSSKATASVVINHGRPVDGRMPSIVGGFKYHGSADPSLKGRFLYIYASGVWTGVQPPESRSNTGHYYTSSPVSGVSCSRSSPLPCHRGGGGSSISGRVLSLGEDNSKDAFFLTTGGVLRVVPPRMCGGGGAPQAPWPPGTGWVISMGVFTWVFALYLIWSYLSGGGQINCNCNNWFSSINVYNGARHHQE